MISRGMSRPGLIEHGPRSGPSETSSHRRHHGAARDAAPTPERTMSPVRHIKPALVREAAIREHPWPGRFGIILPLLYTVELGRRFLNGRTRRTILALNISLDADRHGTVPEWARQVKPVVPNFQSVQNG